MISIIIPIFNEELNIEYLYKRLIDASYLWNEKYELIFIDDGSYDNSINLLLDIVKKNKHVHVIKLSRNFGHQAAISAGIKYAKGDAVVIMDGDLQDPPEELSKFLNKWREGYEVVYAIRTKRKEGILKKLSYKLFYRLLALISNINIPLDSGDFCVMDRKVIDVLNNQMPEQNRFVRGLRAYAGFKQIGIKYDRDNRYGGASKYTLRKLIKLAMDGLFDFSNFPLRLASYFGYIVAIPSFIMGIFFIIHRIFDFKVFGYSPADVPGSATLMVSIFFLSGVILIILGVIGEYIGRIYLEIKKRPLYIVEDIFSKDDN